MIEMANLPMQTSLSPVIASPSCGDTSGSWVRRWNVGSNRKARWNGPFASVAFYEKNGPESGFSSSFGWRTGSSVTCSR